MKLTQTEKLLIYGLRQFQISEENQEAAPDLSLAFPLPVLQELY